MTSLAPPRANYNWRHLTDQCARNTALPSLVCIRLSPPFADRPGTVVAENIVALKAVVDEASLIAGLAAVRAHLLSQGLVLHAWYRALVCYNKASVSSGLASET